MADTLGDALPREMARVRDKVMPAYVEIGPAGAFALAFMRQDLDNRPVKTPQQTTAAAVSRTSISG